MSQCHAGFSPKPRAAAELRVEVPSWVRLLGNKETRRHDSSPCATWSPTLWSPCGRRRVVAPRDGRSTTASDWVLIQLGQSPCWLHSAYPFTVLLLLGHTLSAVPICAGRPSSGVGGTGLPFTMNAHSTSGSPGWPLGYLFIFDYTHSRPRTRSRTLKVAASGGCQTSARASQNWLPWRRLMGRGRCRR